MGLKSRMIKDPAFERLRFRSGSIYYGSSGIISGKSAKEMIVVTGYDFG